MESQSLFHGPIVDDFRPCLRTVTLHDLSPANSSKNE
jgi:hypothetical protein